VSGWLVGTSGSRAVRLERLHIGPQSRPPVVLRAGRAPGSDRDSSAEKEATRCDAELWVGEDAYEISACRVMGGSREPPDQLKGSSSGPMPARRDRR
jgi:hypothetical protein